MIYGQMEALMEVETRGQIEIPLDVTRTIYPEIVRGVRSKVG
jgi:hypothetical protein